MSCVFSAVVVTISSGHYYVHVSSPAQLTAAVYCTCPSFPFLFMSACVLDKARKLLLSCGAHKHVAELVKQWSDVNSKVEHKHNLVAGGCLLNMCADNGKCE